jgi:hypothetical protein
MHPDIEAVVLEILQDYPTGAPMAEVIERARLTPIGAGRPYKVKVACLHLIATERAVLTPELRIRLPEPPPARGEPMVAAVQYAAEIKIPAPAGRTPGAIRLLVDRAFRAGVKEGRRRQEREHVRAGCARDDERFPRVDHGMFRGDHE